MKPLARQSLPIARIAENTQMRGTQQRGHKNPLYSLASVLHPLGVPRAAPEIVRFVHLRFRSLGNHAETRRRRVGILLLCRRDRLGHAQPKGRRSHLSAQVRLQSIARLGLPTSSFFWV
jgi:hypothetical protein